MSLPLRRREPDIRSCQSLSALPLRRAGRGDTDAIERRRGRHIETAQVVVAEAEIGCRLGQADDAETGSVRGEDVDAAGTAAIDVARAVDLHAVGGALARARGLRPDATVGEGTVGRDVEAADVLAFGVVDEQVPLVERKAQAVGLAEIIGQQHWRLRIAADPPDAAEG